MMSTISANDLSTKGVSAIEAALSGECELEAALLQTRSDLAEGNFIKESADAHLTRMQTLIDPKTSPRRMGGA